MALQLETSQGQSSLYTHKMQDKNLIECSQSARLRASTTEQTNTKVHAMNIAY